MGLWRKRFIWSVVPLIIVLLLDLDLPEPEPLGDWALFGETMEKEVEGPIHVFLNCLQKLSKGIWLKLPAVQYSCIR